MARRDFDCSDTRMAPFDTHGHSGPSAELAIDLRAHHRGLWSADWRGRKACWDMPWFEALSTCQVSLEERRQRIRVLALGLLTLMASAVCWTLAIVSVGHRD